MKKGKKKKWWKWLEREDVPVLYAVMRMRSNPSRKEFKEFAKTYLRLILAWDKGVLHIYLRSEDMGRFKKFLVSEVVKETDFMKRLATYHFTLAKKLVNYGDKFGRIDFSKESNQKLHEYLVKFDDKYSELTIYTALGIIGSFALQDVVEPYLHSKLEERNEEASYGKYFSILTHHGGKSWKRLEEESLNRIANRIKKGTLNNDQLKKQLADHTKKFCAVELAYKFLGKPLTMNDFKKRLRKYLKEPLPALPSRKSIERKQQHIINELSIDEKHQKLFSALGRLIYLKEYRDGMYVRSHNDLNMLIAELLKRFGISHEIGWYTTMQEYQQLALTGKLDTREIEKRKELFVWMYDDREYVKSGVEARNLIKKEVGILKEKPQATSEIKGTVASPGYVKGIVKVVLNESELPKVTKGDVLVAYMTKPNFLPAMKKAVAFVTDEGGVTCHAAVVSREMKIPCVIGTKVATQVLNDGDLVEVDADNGIVRVIKRA